MLPCSVHPGIGKPEKRSDFSCEAREDTQTARSSASYRLSSRCSLLERQGYISECLSDHDLSLLDPQLEKLRLRRYESITGAGLAHLGRVRELSLVLLPKFQNSSFEYFGRSLEVLEVDTCSQLSDDCLQYMPNLRQLKWTWGDLSGEGLHYLPKLRRLEIDNVLDIQELHLSRMPALEELVIRTYDWPFQLKDSDFHGLSPSVHTVELCGVDNLTNDALVDFGHVQNLNLDCFEVNTEVDDAGLRHLRAVVEMSLSHMYGITGSGFKHLTALRRLTLCGLNNVVPSSFAHIPQLEALHVINVLDFDIDAALQHLPNLLSLCVDYERSTLWEEAGVGGEQCPSEVGLAAVPRLQVLQLCESIHCLTDAALAHLRNLQFLELKGHLAETEDDFTPAGIAGLRGTLQRVVIHEKHEYDGEDEDALHCADEFRKELGQLLSSTTAEHPVSFVCQPVQCRVYLNSMAFTRVGLGNAPHDSKFGRGIAQSLWML